MKWNIAISLWLFLTGCALAADPVFFHEDFQTLEAWEPLVFPSVANHTQYTIEGNGSTSVLKSESHASASGLLLKESFDVHRFPVLSWRWKVDRIYADTNPQRKSGDDYPIRIYVIFEYDPAQVSFATRMKYRLAKARNGEYPPLAALNYVWASTKSSDSFYFSPFSDRSAMITLEVGPAKVGDWVREQINIAEDYHRIFGGEPPARATLAIMNDSDNTGLSAVSYVDDIKISATEPGQ